MGATLSASAFGQPVDAKILEVIPDTITVKPEAQLEITYFQPRDVSADNPFTTPVEAPIPFTLGVLVKNAGHGTATALKIESQQPRIVEKKNGLVLVAQLLGVRVNDEPRPDAGLTVDLGDILPGQARKGAWDMITSLSGEFIEFNASYTHSSALGGQETSVITSLNAYFIAHEVLNDQPGRDRLRDFLADTDDDRVPDALYETDGQVLPVNELSSAAVRARRGANPVVTVTADRENWVFFQVDDPGQGRLDIEQVVRSDGKVLNPHNAWISVRYSPDTNARITRLNIFDFVALGDYEYEIVYAAGEADSEPPVTQLRFAGEVTEKDGKYYVTPETQLLFTAEDASPVTIYYSLDGGADQPAIPFVVERAGEHSLAFYGRDSAGNQETPQHATVVLSAGPPALTRFALRRNRIVNAGSALSVRPTELAITFEGESTSPGLTAQLDVFRGVEARPTIRGAPSSPSGETSASLVVAGDYVDYYRFRLNGGEWSAERPVGETIELGQLSGAVTVDVGGRSVHGDYLPDEQAARVGWTVVGSAPLVAIGNLPATPSRDPTASLQPSGNAVQAFRYRLDGGALVEIAGDGSIELSGLADGEHVVAVVAKINGVWQDEQNGVEAKWTVDRDYGLRMASLPVIRHVDMQDVGAGLSAYTWDGLQDDGTVPTPGWYTVRLTLRDPLGRTVANAGLVEVGDLMTERAVVAGSTLNLQRYPHARGEWLVWQEQANGNWNIYARNLRTADPPTPITAATRNQERPKTDGRFVVWESRQADGTWDVMLRDLSTLAAAVRVTDTPRTDERNAVVDWPWIAFQSRPAGSPGPWQLRLYHMVDQTTTEVDPSLQDQLDPALSDDILVWQDWRDVGNGEIYLMKLHTGEILRVTDSVAGQYHPAVWGNWIVWSDTRGGQNDLYGYNLLRAAEINLTNTAESETRPSLNGDWVYYEEDSPGVPYTNLRTLNLGNLASVQLTNARSEKRRPVAASGQLVWLDDEGGYSQVMLGPLPKLQAVSNNNNAVVITQPMSTFQADAHGLLGLWNRQAGVQAVTRFVSWPAPHPETSAMEGTVPAGTNFALTPGSFVWARFHARAILDLGFSTAGPIDLGQGINVVSYSDFPDELTAYGVIASLGRAKVGSVRMLDAKSGQWRAAVVVGDKILGSDFRIDNIAVLMLDMKEGVPQWIP